jgi:hypothetical protein
MMERRYDILEVINERGVTVDVNKPLFTYAYFYASTRSNPSTRLRQVMWLEMCEADSNKSKSFIVNGTNFYH